MERVTIFLEATPSYLTGLQQHAHGLLYIILTNSMTCTANTVVGTGA